MTGVGNTRRAWTPEANDEVAAVLRQLMVQPWLVVGRHDDAIGAVRRNTAAIRDVLGRLGWVLVIERDVIRLRKSPPPRRDAWAAVGPHPRTCSWFFLLVAAAESLPPRTGLSSLALSARSAAAEAGIATTGDIVERRAIANALKELDRRGIIEQLEGDVTEYIHDETTEVLFAVHHLRLMHVVANVGPADPDRDPESWLQAVERESDPARRMRRRLVDDAVVHGSDLDDAEADWMSRRVRGDDGEPLARAFGLHLERRGEGAAFVVPDDTFRHPYELGPLQLPAVGTVPHAALLVCDHVQKHGVQEGGPGSGWRGVDRQVLGVQLTQLCDVHGATWRGELTDDIDAFLDAIERLLSGLGMLRIDAGGESQTWWFSPATGRWDIPPATQAPRRQDKDDSQLLLTVDGGGE
ncbi:MAG: TIGR02678 family protein [Pseudonocardiaceae bacterium]